MKCAFCGREFQEDAARRACQACAVAGGCRRIRCPWCGYETPEEPALFRRLRGLLRRLGHRKGDADADARG